MFAFILCSVISWLCPLPKYSPSIPPTIAPVVSESFYGIGYPWNDTTDEGYCGEDLSGSGWTGRLSWPVNSPVMAENKRFKITHTGIDLKSPYGANVNASVPGRVVWAGFTSWGLGELVVLSHGGNWYTYYAHLSEVVVLCGQNVSGLIGYVGQSGAASCPHLHIEVRNGRLSYNPENYLPNIAAIEERLCE